MHAQAIFYILGNVITSKFVYLIVLNYTNQLLSLYNNKTLHEGTQQY